MARPSTMYSSVFAGSRSEQSASLPGNPPPVSADLRTASRALRAASRARAALSAFSRMRLAMGGHEAPTSRTFRLGGLVQEGSVKRDGVKVSFIVTDTVKAVPVSYEGRHISLKSSTGRAWSAAVPARWPTSSERSPLGPTSGCLN